MSLKERFEKKFKVLENGCWEWQAASVGGSNKHTYGQFGVASGKMKLAHRVSYELYKGPIPEGMKVCHKCDYPRCVNPDHLFLGTHKDNMQDMVLKGRKNPIYGTKHHKTKLSIEAVQEIRNTPGVIAPLARKFGVSLQTIKQVRSGKVWRILE